MNSTPTLPGGEKKKTNETVSEKSGFIFFFLYYYLNLGNLFFTWERKKYKQNPFGFFY